MEINIRFHVLQKISTRWVQISKLLKYDKCEKYEIII